MRKMAAGFSIANAGWATANMALYLPVMFPANATLYAIRFHAANGTGNYDLGLYDEFLTLVASTGSTAMSAAGVKSLTLPEYRVQAGRIYYAALAISSTSGQIVRWAITARDGVAVGVGQQATALPLPDPAVPVTLTTAVIPIFAFGVR